MLYRSYESIFSELGLKFNEEIQNKINLYLDLLFEWNEKTNLTSCSREEFLEKHFIFSLNFVPLVKDFGIIFDFGSGNGVPGIPISLFLPQKKVFLVENKQRKVAFLEYAVGYLKINAIVLNSAYETFDESLDNFCVVSKAFNDFKVMKRFFRRGFDLFIPLTDENLLKGVKVLAKYSARIGEFSGYFYRLWV
ncbi:MAG: 16S rRNA (guanine(527)-N(7))-methyltransferase RsmG [Brevinematia bacterium]